MHRWAKFGLSALSLTLALGLSSGCGDGDELPDSGIGEPPVTGGTGGGVGVPAREPGGIGDRCEANGDCNSGLCLPADDTEDTLTVGTPPGGLCTAPCETDDDCPEASTFCVPFTLDAAYCVPSCLLGTPFEDENKCFSRPEMSCQVLTDESGIPCDSTRDCPEPLYCFEGECSVAALCLPRCNSNADCPEGRFCDLGLGECVTEERDGRALGEPCDPEAAVDPCRGLCVDLTGNGDGECVEFCTLGAPSGCGFEDATNAPVVCAGGFDVGEPIGDLDDGFCAQVCACNDECPGEQRCLDSSDLEPVCMTGVPEAESIAECPAG
jgi:hypothetical protein